MGTFKFSIVTTQAGRPEPRGTSLPAPSIPATDDASDDFFRVNDAVSISIFGGELSKNHIGTVKFGGTEYPNLERGCHWARIESKNDGPT